MERIKLLSLVVPTYRQEKIIVKNIKYLENTLSKLPCKYELLVVVDGIVDKTIDKLKKIKSKNLKILYYKKNHGKGYAVRYGISKANGDTIGFIDAGMDISPNSMSTLLVQMKTNNADIMIGSKLHPNSNIKYPPIRKILSWGYRNITRILFGFNVRDTQAGLKFFKRKVATTIFPKLKVNRFAFDVEMLALAEQLGFDRIYEGPINFNFKKNTITSLNFFKIALETFLDTLLIFIRIKVLKNKS